MRPSIAKTTYLLRVHSFAHSNIRHPRTGYVAGSEPLLWYWFSWWCMNGSASISWSFVATGSCQTSPSYSRRVMSATYSGIVLVTLVRRVTLPHFLLKALEWASVTALKDIWWCDLNHILIPVIDNCIITIPRSNLGQIC